MLWVSVLSSPVNRISFCVKITRIKVTVLKISTPVQRTNICENSSLKIHGVFKKRPNLCYKNFILQHFKHCPLQSSPLYWGHTVPNVSSIAGMLPGTHFLWWRAVLLSHFPESPRAQKGPNFLNSSPTSIEGALRAQAVRRINPTNSLCMCSVQRM